MIEFEDDLLTKEDKRDLAIRCALRLAIEISESSGIKNDLWLSRLTEWKEIHDSMGEPLFENDL